MPNDINLSSLFVLYYFIISSTSYFINLLLFKLTHNPFPIFDSQSYFLLYNLIYSYKQNHCNLSYRKISCDFEVAKISYYFNYILMLVTEIKLVIAFSDLFYNATTKFFNLF